LFCVVPNHECIDSIADLASFGNWLQYPLTMFCIFVIITMLRDERIKVI
jgi:hypothetical protein